MKNHIIALSAIMLLSSLSGVHAATMEDKPMPMEMKQTMPATGSESMTKQEATGAANPTMMPATNKGATMVTKEKTQKMQGKKEKVQHGAMKESSKMAPAAPMMDKGKAADTMGTMQSETKESMKP
jgi:hypothetical protein